MRLMAIGPRRCAAAIDGHRVELSSSFRTSNQSAAARYQRPGRAVHVTRDFELRFEVALHRSILDDGRLRDCAKQPAVLQIIEQ